MGEFRVLSLSRRALGGANSAQTASLVPPRCSPLVPPNYSRILLGQLGIQQLELAIAAQVQQHQHPVGVENWWCGVVWCGVVWCGVV